MYCSQIDPKVLQTEHKQSRMTPPLSSSSRPAHISPKPATVTFALVPTSGVLHQAETHSDVQGRVHVPPCCSYWYDFLIVRSILFYFILFLNWVDPISKRSLLTRSILVSF